MRNNRHISFLSTGRRHLNAGAPPVPTPRLIFLPKINFTISAPSLLGHLLPTHPNFQTAIALALLLMVPPAVLPLPTMAFIRTVGQIIVRRHSHPLINPLRVIGVNRLSNRHILAPMPPVRLHRSIRRGALPDNALPAYRVPQMVPLDRPTTLVAIMALLEAYVVGTAHRHKCRLTHLRALLAEVLAICLLGVHLPAKRLHVPITATLLPPPRLLLSPGLHSPVHRYYMRQRHVRHGLRHCHKAFRQRINACHVMIANYLSPSQILLPFVVADSKADYAVFSSTLRSQSMRRNHLPPLRLLHHPPTELWNRKAMQQMWEILVLLPRNRRRKSAQHCSIPASMHRPTIYPFLLQCRLLPWSFVS